MKRNFIILLAIATIPVIGVAIAQQSHDGHMAASSAGAFTAANDKMMRDMTIEATGDTDADFVRMMIPHHQGAIDMAKIELEHGKDPMLREMATQIIEAQEAEITTLTKWLKDRGL